MKKFKVSFEGLLSAFRDRSVQIQLGFAVLAIAAGLIFKFSLDEWVVVALMIGFVVTTEIVNTCIERLCDFVQPEFDLKIKLIKDMSSAAVLVSAFSALVAGILILLKHC